MRVSPPNWRRSIGDIVVPCWHWGQFMSLINVEFGSHPGILLIHTMLYYDHTVVCQEFVSWFQDFLNRFVLDLLPSNSNQFKLFWMNDMMIYTINIRKACCVKISLSIYDNVKRMEILLGPWRSHFQLCFYFMLNGFPGGVR